MANLDGLTREELEARLLRASTPSKFAMPEGFKPMYGREQYEADCAALNAIKGRLLQMLAEGKVSGIAAKPELDAIDRELDKADVKLRMTRHNLTFREREKNDKRLKSIRTWEKSKGITHHTNPVFGVRGSDVR